ncbi:hypothetical protein KUTeg_007264 [Tegillarca granosa]|uniref:Inner centromere protein ARK-binding domain-containing protein n=1 Tax=Tegillarca granosa TaxID=220873 RepID=A0ABQ9FCQ9_TEGGR|nr:hypothetical protein KUTeg_007264 [Tegillarca granosa]
MSILINGNKTMVHCLGIKAIQSINTYTADKLKKYEEDFLWLQEILAECKRTFAKPEVELLPKTPSAKRAKRRVKRKQEEEDDVFENTVPNRISDQENIPEESMKTPPKRSYRTRAASRTVTTTADSEKPKGSKGSSRARNTRANKATAPTVPSPVCCIEANLNEESPVNKNVKSVNFTMQKETTTNVNVNDKSPVNVNNKTPINVNDKTPVCNETPVNQGSFKSKTKIMSPYNKNNGQGHVKNKITTFEELIEANSPTPKSEKTQAREDKNVPETPEQVENSPITPATTKRNNILSPKLDQKSSEKEENFAVPSVPPSKSTRTKSRKRQLDDEDDEANTSLSKRSCTEEISSLNTTYETVGKNDETLSDHEMETDSPVFYSPACPSDKIVRPMSFLHNLSNKVYAKPMSAGPKIVKSFIQRNTPPPKLTLMEDEIRQYQELQLKKREQEEQERQKRIADEIRRQKEQQERYAMIEKERWEERERLKKLEEEKEQERLKQKEEREKQLAKERAEKEKQDAERKKERDLQIKKGMEKIKELEKARLQEEQKRRDELREREQAIKEMIHKHNTALANAVNGSSSQSGLPKPNLNTTQTLNTSSEHRQNNPDSYDMTPAKKIKIPSTFENYDISDIKSDDSTDDEDAPRKRIPPWASGPILKSSLINQHFNPPDLDQLFDRILPPDLNELFVKKKARFNKRTSSAHWDSPILKPGAMLHYNHY